MPILSNPQLEKGHLHSWHPDDELQGDRGPRANRLNGRIELPHNPDWF